MQKTAIYIDMSRGKSRKEFIKIFRKICGNLVYFDTPSQAIKKLKIDIDSEWGLVIFDIRGHNSAKDIVNNFFTWLTARYSYQRTMLIYDDTLDISIQSLSIYYIDYFLPNSADTKIIKRVIGRLQRDIKNSNYEQGNSNCDTLLKSKSQYLMTKSQDIREIIETMYRINSNLVNIELDQNSEILINKLFRFTEKLQKNIDDITEVIKPHISKDEEYFDLNILLNLLHTILIDDLNTYGVKLIYKVSNSVPSKLYGDRKKLKLTISKIIRYLLNIVETDRIIIEIDIEEKNNLSILKLSFLTKDSDFAQAKSIFISFKSSKEYQSIVNALDKNNMTISYENETILSITIPTKIKDRRSYRLPNKKMMNKKVLIIDEDSDEAKSLKNLLDYFHFITDIAKDESEAEKRLNRYPYDVIYADSKFKTFIQRVNRNIKTVFIENQSKSSNVDYDNIVLYKPFTHQDIFETILDLYYDESAQKEKDTIEVYKDYMKFLFQGDETILVISSKYSDKISLNLILEDCNIKLKFIDSIDTNIQNYIDSRFILIDIDEIIKDFNQLETISYINSEYDIRDKLIGIAESVNVDLGEIKEALGVDKVFYRPISPIELYQYIIDKVSHEI